MLHCGFENTTMGLDFFVECNMYLYFQIKIVPDLKMVSKKFQNFSETYDPVVSKSIEPGQKQLTCVAPCLLTNLLLKVVFLLIYIVHQQLHNSIVRFSTFFDLSQVKK